MARRRTSRGGRAADRLRPLAREPAQAPDARSLQVQLPPVPRPLSVGDDVRHLERGQPLRPADLPPPAAGGGLLPRAAARVPQVHHLGRRDAGHAQHGQLDRRLPEAPWPAHRAALLGAAQLHRRQPDAYERDADDDQARQGPDLVHRDGRDRRPAQQGQGRLPGVSGARGACDTLGLRRARPAQPPHHPGLPVPLERGPRRQLGLRADRCAWPRTARAAGRTHRAARQPGARAPAALATSSSR